MNAKGIWLAGLVATLCAGGLIRAQSPGTPFSQTATADPSAPRPESMAITPAPLGTFSSYLLYPRAEGCCDPVGGHGPIGTELYVRSGVAFMLNSEGLAGALDDGWAIQGGFRSYFFNVEQNRAWYVDVGLLNINYDANDSGRQFRLLNVKVDSNTETGAPTTVVPQRDVFVRNLNQTFVTGGIGREWWLTGSADLCADHVNWRVGIDGGGRWGSSKLETSGFKNRTDVIGSLYVAAHSDVEIPWGNCMFLLGIRGEYSYTWSDILQIQNYSDTQQFLLMGNLGLRF